MRGSGVAMAMAMITIMVVLPGRSCQKDVKLYMPEHRSEQHWSR